MLSQARTSKEQQWFLHILENITLQNPKGNAWCFCGPQPTPPRNMQWFSIEAVFWKITTVCPTPSPPIFILMLPDQVKLIVPGIDVEDWPNSDHVVVTISHILNVLMLQWHLT